MALTDSVSLISLSPVSKVHETYRKHRTALAQTIQALHRLHRAVKIPKPTMLAALLQGKEVDAQTEVAAKVRIESAVYRTQLTVKTLHESLTTHKKQMRTACKTKAAYAASPAMHVHRDTADNHMLLELLRDELRMGAYVVPGGGKVIGATNLKLLPIKLGNGSDALRILGDFYLQIPSLCPAGWANIWNTKTNDWHKGPVILPVNFGGITLNLAERKMRCDTGRSIVFVAAAKPTVALTTDETPDVALLHMAMEIRLRIFQLLEFNTAHIMPRTIYVPLQSLDLGDSTYAYRTLNYNPDTGKITHNPSKYAVVANTIERAEGTLNHIQAGRRPAYLHSDLADAIAAGGVPRPLHETDEVLSPFTYIFTG